MLATMRKSESNWKPELQTTGIGELKGNPANVTKFKKHAEFSGGWWFLKESFLLFLNNNINIEQNKERWE